MSTSLTGFLFIIGAVITDVLANICLKKSNGFQKKLYGITALFLVAAAFYFLSLALQNMELSIAYASFGALGIVLTTLADKALFRLRLRRPAIIGILLMLIGIIMIKTV